MRTKPFPVHRSIHTHLTALFPGLRLPMWAVTRKVRPISILLKQLSKRQWVAVASAATAGPYHRQVCTSLQADNHASNPPLCFYRPDAFPAAQPTASKHWRHRSYSTYRKFSCFSSHHFFDTHIYTVYVNSSAASTRSRDRPGQTLSNLFNIPVSKVIAADEVAGPSRLERHVASLALSRRRCASQSALGADAWILSGGRGASGCKC